MDNLANNAGNGRGRGRGNVGGRGRGRGQQRNHAERIEAAWQGREDKIARYTFTTIEDGGVSTGETTRELNKFMVSDLKKYVKEIGKGLSDGVLIDPQEPTEPTDATRMPIYIMNLKKYHDKVEEFDNFRTNFYNKALGQCSAALEEQITSHPDFGNVDHDGFALMRIIKELTTTFADRRSTADAQDEILNKFHVMKQGDATLLDWCERITSAGDVIKDYGATIAGATLIEEVAARNGRAGNPNDMDRNAAHQEALGVRFIKGASKDGAELLKDLRNAFLVGRDEWPKTLHSAYTVISRREPTVVENRQRHQAPEERRQGIVFAQRERVAEDGPPVIGLHGVAMRPEIRCNTCGDFGHFSNHCPGGQGKSWGRSVVLQKYSFAQAVNKKLWDRVLLDSQSSVDVFCNASLLTDIHYAGSRMYIQCNAGTLMTDMQGTLPGYGIVWYSEKAIANILSLNNVRSRSGVVYLDEEGKFTVTNADGSVDVYVADEDGLHSRCATATECATATLLVATVDDNKDNYTKSEVNRANRARTLQIRLGRPSTADFIHIVNHNLLPNNPVTERDIKSAEAIYGQDVGSIKGKTVRRSPNAVAPKDRVQLPPSSMERYKDVTIAVDIMYINGLAFLTSISRDLKFGTIECIANRKTATIMAGLASIKKTYGGGGFNVTLGLVDGEFDGDKLREGCADIGISLNSAGADSHVGEIERYHRVLKERVRATWNTLPFEHMPAKATMELASGAVFWLNSFAKKDGVSSTLSPRTIITGQTLDYNRHCQYEFGEYVQTHEATDNTTASRTVGALAMRPTGNDQGSWYFLSLATGKILNRDVATRLPMPREVIDQVHRMARRQKVNRGLVFGTRTNEPFHADVEYDSDADSDYSYASDDDDDDEDDNGIVDHLANDGAGDQGVYHGHDDGNENDNDNDDASSEDPSQSEDESSKGESDEDESSKDESRNYDDGQVEIHSEDDESSKDELRDNDDGQVVNRDNDDGQVVNNHDGQVVSNNDDGQVVSNDDDGQVVSNDDDGQVVRNDDDGQVVRNDDDGQVVIETVQDEEAGVSEYAIEPIEMFPQDGGTEREEMNAKYDAKYGERSGKHNLRPRRDPGYSVSDLHVTMAGVGSDDEVEDEEMATEQMSMKRGIKEFGQLGVDAVAAELKMLHDRVAVKPMKPKELNAEQRRDALAYHMYLKRKRNGKVKGRGCADGRKQRAWTNKEDSTSPTVSTEAVFLTAVIDAHEGRDVAVVDIPNAFLQADMDESVHIRFTGKMVELLLEIDPELYGPCITYEGKEKVMYVELLKALYGTLRAAKLFWEKLSAQLEEWGFVANPHDPCVMNKIINGKQFTIAFHVDDLKLSHMETKVVDSVIEKLDEEFGKEAPLTKSRGKVHEYLGMTLDFSKPGELTVDMVDYTKTVIAGMPDEMKGKAKTPAGSHLFTVNDNPVLLDNGRKETFHRMVMQLLYLSQRGRPDIRTAISFLCKRTSIPDEDDWRKLVRVMRYLQKTLYLKLRLSADGTGLIKWWVDASFAVHHDMKSHTGATMSLGSGSIYSMSAGQKLVTRSSTESELVGLHDALPQALWTRRFLEAQGFEVVDTIIYQDNMSAMLLEKNGRASSGKRTRHIQLRFFFAKDCIDNNEISVEYCPTKEMLGDFHTKPLQGHLFYKLRALIMNIDPSSEFYSEQRSVLNESVTLLNEPVVDAGKRVTYADVVRSTDGGDGWQRVASR